MGVFLFLLLCMVAVAGFAVLFAFLLSHWLFPTLIVFIVLFLVLMAYTVAKWDV